MKKLKIAAAAVAIAGLSGLTWTYRRADGKEAPAFKTTAITRTTIKATVSATGALQAVRTVQVGTQVSGQVAQIFVDFNDKVKKGQLLARIDPTLQQQAVQDAQAQLERTQAQLQQAQDDYERNKTLFDAKVLTAAEFGATRSTFAVQQATVKSAQIALDRAKQNLSYTTIYAPIDGVIVERNVDVGQTVAASLSAPQLFLIANDLGEMQILASVDESDIGQIKEGQSVQFTVQSYPNDHFTGVVKQVRLQSTTTDNVVNYTAVVGVKNDGGKLLPGMTATVQFVTADAVNVLTVPNAALRITPPAELLAAVDTTAKARPAPDSATRARFAAGRGGSATGAPTGAQTGARPQAVRLWIADQAGKLTPVRVRTGLTDGQKTQVEGPGITEGMQIVTSVSSGGAATAAASAAATNPFQPARPQQGATGRAGR